MTSFAVTASLRRLSGQKKAGHIGTLDPFADGLLPVCLGPATRIIRFTDDYDKSYLVTVAFGRATDTQDLTGQPLWGQQPSAAELALLRQNDYADLRTAVAGLVKIQSQVPPMYSAVKVKGRPLYEYARKGLELERAARPVKIHTAELVEIIDGPGLAAVLRIHCSKGTYIRSLCHELGSLLGWGAHAAALRRLTCGPFDLADAQPLSQLADTTALAKALLDPGAALVGLPQLELDRPAAAALIMGQAVFTEKNCPDGLFSIWAAGRLIAVGRAVRQQSGSCRIKTERVLSDLADIQELK